MEEYSWKMKGFAYGVDPNVAAEELKRLQNVYNGKLTPIIIVNESKNLKSVLHPIFQWDDEKAAEGYRIQQARYLLNNIQVIIKTDGEPKIISVYEVTSASGTYKSYDTFSPTDVKYVRETTLQQLNLLKGKLQFYKEFDKVVFHLNQAIEVI